MISLFRRRALPTSLEVQWDGGPRTLLRTTVPADGPRFERGYAHLSEASRRQRFFGQSSALSRTQVRFLTEIDQVNHSAWGAMDLDRPDDPGMGVGRYIRDPQRPTLAEIALTVLDSYQHRGVGMALHGCLHLTAAQHGIRGFVYDVSQENERFLHHLKALGAHPLGVTEHIVRLEMKVYASAGRVPEGTEAARRFAAVIRRLESTARDGA